ncbi:MAG: TolC family protein, partial [Planctomycetes bacterium]|nr:TolC family protein [Planctomycetota bacterium]
MRRDILGLVGALLLGGALAAADPVTVAELVERAQRTHPTAAAIAAARAAADAQVRQAAVWSNPELQANLGRTRPRVADLDPDTPYGASLSQRLDWWWARSARRDGALARRAAGLAAEAAARQALAGEVRQAAIAYAAADAAAGLAAREAALADELAATAVSRHAAGALDGGELARVRLEAAQAGVRRQGAARSAAAALARLRSWTGGELDQGLVVADALPDPQPAAAASGAGTHPRLTALDHQLAAAGADAEAARAARWPQLTLGAFANREADKDTFGATIGLDLPLWDRGEAALAAASAEQQRISAERRLAALELERERAAAQAAYDDACAEATALRGTVLPLAAEAVRLRTASWRAGETPLSERLEARRA